MEKTEQQLYTAAEEQQHPAHKPVIARLKHAIGLDRAIAFTVLARGWSTVAGVVTLLLIARFLTPAEQGYYYTFSSLIALQIIFELGFSFVILQMASHERVHLSISSDYVITGDSIAHARLASVIQKTVRWYSAAAVLMAITLVPAGLVFFNAHEYNSQHIFWRTPWCFAALAATLNFQLDPILSFFEGCGFIANVARVRFFQAIVCSILGWTALTTHFGLFVPAMMMCGTASVSLVWLYGKRRFLLGLLTHRPGPNSIHWGVEVWPFQWRIAISWLCGYFIFQLFNPVLFAFKGPVAAGQMGMSLSVTGALQAVAISWISTKSAPFGAMIERKDYSKLDHVFFRAVVQSVAVYMLGAFAICLCIVGLNYANIRLAHRLLAPLPLSILLAATGINIVVFAEALYLRAHKQEKFLLNSIFTGLFVGLSTYFLGKHYGAEGMVIGYLTVVVCVSFGMGTCTFIKYRRIWHAR